MDVQSDCQVVHDFTGAMAVSIFFLAIFVGLLVADAILTWYALTRALQRNQILEKERRETLKQLDEVVAKRMEELRLLNQRVVACIAKKAPPEYSKQVSVGWNLQSM